MVVRESSQGVFTRNIEQKSLNDLSEGDVLIKVNYSSLNYKDVLSAMGNKGVTRVYPHTPGIDAAGIIEQCGTTNFKIGEPVIVTGYDLGMNTSGGFAEYVWKSDILCSIVSELPDLESLDLQIEQIVNHSRTGRAIVNVS
jgi:NADPH:quinone reductase-like Zn-dependent oxidoreductase